MIAAGEGPHSGKQVCGQFGSFIPGMRSFLLSLAILHSGLTGFLSSWDESIEEGEAAIHLLRIINYHCYPSYDLPR